MPERGCRGRAINPTLCCRGACLQQATHEVVITTGSSESEHLRCPACLAWSKDNQRVTSVRELAGA